MHCKALLDDLTFPKIGKNESEEIREIIFDTIGSLSFADRINVISIVAYGTMITGEGAPPFSDLELYAITRFYDPTLARRLENALNRPKAPVMINVGQLHYPLLRKWKSIQANDIKSSGKVICGDPAVLNAIRVSPSQIPKYDSIKILLNLGVDKLNAIMSSDILNRQYIPDSQKGKFSFNCVKANITICRALLNFVGEYHSSLIEGANVFKDSYKGSFPTLHRSNPQLADDVLLATNIRLSFDYDQIRDPIGYWFRTQRNVKDTLIFLLQNYFLEKTNNELELILLLERLPHRLASNVIYLLRTSFLITKQRIPFLHSLLADPWIKAHIASSFLLWAVNPNSTVDASFVKRAYNKLGEAFVLDGLTVFDLRAWNRLREIIVRLNESSILPQPLLRSDYSKGAHDSQAVR